MKLSVFLGALLGAASLVVSFAVQADEAHRLPDAQGQADGPTALDEAVFALGGFYHSTGYGEIYHPWDIRYNDDSLVGLGYQKFFHTAPDGFSFGVELGAAGRLSHQNLSGEIWGGVVGRYDGFVIGDALRIAPAITFGLSYVTGKVDTEAKREIESGDSADLLFYLGPEISFSNPQSPEWEAFVRLQHRSGAWGTLAHMDGANATTFGIRHRF